MEKVSFLTLGLAWSIHLTLNSYFTTVNKAFNVPGETETITLSHHITEQGGIMDAHCDRQTILYREVFF